MLKAVKSEALMLVSAVFVSVCVCSYVFVVKCHLLCYCTLFHYRSVLSVTCRCRCHVEIFVLSHMSKVGA